MLRGQHPTEELAPSECSDLADFYHLFNNIGFTEDDQNWLSPHDWLREDASDPGYQLMSDQEIVDTVTADGDGSDSDDDEQDDPPQRTHAQAYSAFECALEWQRVIQILLI
jgi:hypothetical protein